MDALKEIPFFCYVCLLLGGRDEFWAEIGDTDLLPLRIKIQDVSSEHLQNELSFTRLRKVNIVR